MKRPSLNDKVYDFIKELTEIKTIEEVREIFEVHVFKSRADMGRMNIYISVHWEGSGGPEFRDRTISTRSDEYLAIHLAEFLFVVASEYKVKLAEFRFRDAIEGDALTTSPPSPGPENAKNKVLARNLCGKRK